MEKLEGYVEKIRFRKEENRYTVFDLSADDEEITCVGFFQAIDAGEFVELNGEYTVHPVFGEQFCVSSYEIKEPTDAVAIERYLGSGAVKGVGQALASRIVKRFGKETFHIIEEEPERLAEVKGISEKKAREIAIQVVEKRELRQAIVFLQNYGITLALAVKIYNRYGMQTYSIIRENPYKLADEITGVGFKIADEIASKAGIHTDSDFRVRSGILYVLQAAVSEGHCFLPKEVLLERAKELLLVSQEIIWIQVTNLCVDRKVILWEVAGQIRVYAKTYYYMELNCANLLKSLDVVTDENEEQIKNTLISIMRQEEYEVDDLQIEAALKAVQRGVFVMTGGPGTGKTTTINLIIKYFEKQGLDIYLAAPTGRAAKRMTEATGYEACTIQRLLKLNGIPEDGTAAYRFEKNEEDPLEADVIIIDEMSMVDLSLFQALLRAITVGTRLIMVGDMDQLPSVGPGTVLKDLISSGRFEVVCLKRIFRQSEQSDIILNAHRINEGKPIRLDNKSRDFFFFARDDVNVIMKVLIVLIKEKLPRYVNADPFDIQVLTPMRKGILGVENLNPILQKYLNPQDGTKEEKEYGNTVFREGDKVMQIKNNYQLEWSINSKYGMALEKGLGVFNGDMGIVKKINSYSETMSVEYEDHKIVEYPFSGLDELELAYAVTIHKSQGSEYPAVLIPLLQGPKMLFTRNLLYTGVTRAKSCVALIGSSTQIEQMIANASEQRRYTGLKERLMEEIMEETN